MDNVVYLHKDSEGNIRYVGSGKLERANKLSAVSNRGLAYENFVRNHGKMKVEVIADNLSKEQSLIIERDIYESLKNTQHLLNSRPPVITAKDIPLHILELVKYSENTEGCLVWAGGTNSGKRLKGATAGSKSKIGYYNTKIKNVLYANHRIIFKIHNIEVDMSGMVIDHIDQDKSNNRIENLRLVSDAVNSRNKAKNVCNSVASILGVSFDEKNQRYIASVTIPNERLRSGKPRVLQKTFSIKKYGHKAFDLAVNFREENLKLINDRLSLGYTSEYFVSP